MDPEVVTDIVNNISKYFGELTVTHGNKHTFLGMNLTIRKDKKIEVEMKDRLLETIEALVEELTGKVLSPAASHLMFVNNESEPLDAERMERFHLVTAKVLFLTKQARPDI